MVLVQWRRRYHLAMLLAAACVGCGDAPEVVVNVAVPEGAAALAEVTRVDVSVTKGTQRIAFRQVDYAARAAIDLGELPIDDRLLLGVVGRDASGTPVVYGQLTPDLADAEGLCCVTVCLCSAAVQARNGCTCGSGTCDQACDH